MADKKIGSETEKKFIEVVDGRVADKMNGVSITYTGVVVSVSTDNKSARVRLLANDSVFNLKNKTGEILSVNDSVDVYAKDGNFNNATISMRFGNNNGWNGVYTTTGTLNGVSKTLTITVVNGLISSVE